MRELRNPAPGGVVGAGLRGLATGCRLAMQLKPRGTPGGSCGGRFAAGGTCGSAPRRSPRA
jgi:hypothetical protein